MNAFHVTVAVVAFAWLTLAAAWGWLARRHAHHRLQPIRVHPHWLKLQLALVAVGGYVLISGRHLLFARFPVPDGWQGVSYALGALLLVFGMGFAIWARVELGRWWSPRPTIFRDQPRITTGPYRFTGHPIYVGISLMLIGTLLATQFEMLLRMTPILIAFYAIKAYMEQSLLSKSDQGSSADQ
ncbi:MAG: hypothetical protein HY423_04735 [Candidatus Lambdaproteobacteria bacterium]|nr:hypothetical protein [Candidatus Lambdaproteobacteria bacterium]